MTRKLMLLALLLVLTTPVAMAGGYVGAGVGQATQQAQDSDINLDLSGDDTGYKVFAGWSIMKFFGVEVSYVEFGTVKDDISGIEVKTDATAWDGFLIGKIPIAFFEPFVKVGYASVSSKATLGGSTSASDTAWDPAYGVGVGFNILKKLHLRAEYEKFDINPDYDGEKPNSELYMVSVSAGWRF